MLHTTTKLLDFTVRPVAAKLHQTRTLKDRAQAMSQDSPHPPLSIVSFAVAPGPGGPEAAVSAEFIRALAQHWQGPVAVFSAGQRPQQDRERISTFAAADPLLERSTNERRWFGLAEQAARSRLSIGRVISRFLYERSGYSIKYHAWERWVVPRLSEQIERYKDTVVVSRALPLCSLAATYRVLRSRSNPWLVNLNDPCPPGLWTGLYPLDEKTQRLQARTFERLLPRIDAFAFPSRMLMELHTKAYPQILERPIRILPHVAPPLEPRSGEVNAKATDTLKIGFAGTLRQERYHPALLEALESFTKDHTPSPLGKDDATSSVGEKPRISIHAFLTTESRALDDLSHHSPLPVHIHSGLEGPQIDRRLEQMDVLLNIESATDAPLLLTKMVSYLRFNKPILALCAEDGTTWELLERTKAGLAVPFNDASKIEQGLVSIAHLHALRESVPTSLEACERFQPRHIIAALAGLVHDQASGKKGLRGEHWP